MKKKLLYFLIIIPVLTVGLCYTTIITNIPNSLILFQGEKLEFSNMLGLKISNKNDNILKSYEATPVSTNLDTTNLGKMDMSLNLIGWPLKNITVNVIPTATVIPAGNNIGIKLYTSGVLVVGMSEISGVDNKVYKPYEKTEIKEGDMIIAVNNTAISNTAELVQQLNASQGNEVELQCERNGNTYETSIDPVKTDDNQYKLGLWVRDGTARSRYNFFL